MDFLKGFNSVFAPFFSLTLYDWGQVLGAVLLICTPLFILLIFFVVARFKRGY